MIKISITTTRSRRYVDENNLMYVSISLKNLTTIADYLVTTSPPLSFAPRRRLDSCHAPFPDLVDDLPHKNNGTKSSAGNRSNEGIPRAAEADQTLSTPVSTRRELGSIGPLGRRLVVLHSPLPAHSRNGYVPSLSNNRPLACMHTRSSTWTDD